MLDFSLFSARLRALRKEKKATQEELAHLLEVTTNHYQKIEYGQINISVTVLSTLADYFGVSTDYLLGRSEE
ncbi:helix-turn-helix domain-containing protein [Intestinimonas sp.]|uniref:helix-turn-helix domain-containing protein n=1 Tax=Intestinimonas sp. TaxID=1965293 RepID=UPI0026263D93|nr:helix-turn-helix transcriptional regulator [Intestinimonas sp.]